MPRARRNEPTRCAVQVLPWPVGMPMRFGRCGDVLVGPAASHAAHHGDHLFGSLTTVLASFWLADAQLGMLATLPVDDEHDLADLLINVGDELRDQGPHQSLARSHRRPRRFPCRREIVSQSSEVGARVADIGCLQSIEPPPARLDMVQPATPSVAA